MKLKSAYPLVFLVVFLSCTSSKDNTNANKDVLPASELKPYGRALIDAQQNLELISSAVHFGFNFSGKSCTVYASIADANGHNYLQYELDGIYQKRLKITGGSVQPIEITAATEGKHIVWIYKATEATTGPIFIQKITGNNLNVITPSNAPLIEFIGNSK